MECNAVGANFECLANPWLIKGLQHGIARFLAKFHWCEYGATWTRALCSNVSKLMGVVGTQATAQPPMHNRW